MTASWKDFLHAIGARLHEGGGCDFGDPAREAAAALGEDVISDLSAVSGRGFLQVSGADSERFLQGQLTCDLTEISPERSRLGAWCTPRGRVLVLLRVLRRDGRWLLCLPGTLLEPTLTRLRMYVLRSDVHFADASADLAGIGVAGPRAGEMLARQAGALPDAPGALLCAGPLQVMRLRGARPRFEVVGPPPQMRALWEALAQRAATVGTGAWRLLDVLEGVPEVYPATAEAFLPQMLNLDLLDGVSFRKGCYTGQEVVARTQHLGRLKRRMFLARAAVDATPAPGQRVNASGAGNVGTVVDAAPHPEGGCALLAVVQLDAVAEGGDLRLEPEGVRLALQDLPYAVPR